MRLNHKMVICVALLMLPLSIFAQKPVEIAALPSPDMDVPLLKRIYARAGIPLVITVMPGLRSTAEATSGRVDGEVARGVAYGKEHQTLLRIDPPLYFWTVSAFYKKTSTVNITTATDLKKYSIAYVKGIKTAEILTQGIKQVEPVATSEAASKMLKADRVQVIVNGSNETNFYFNKWSKKEQDNIVQVDLVHIPLHHYLHEKNKDLAIIIGNTIRLLADSGELEKLQKEAENDFFNF